MRFYYFLIVCSLITISSCSQNRKKPTPLTEPKDYSKVALFQDNDLWGYKNEKGAILIQPTYIIANDFDEYGHALVADQSALKYINWKGKAIVYPFIFDNGADEFKEGLSRYVENEKIGFINKKCEVVVKATYDFAYPFSEGVAAVCIGCKKVTDAEHGYVTGGNWGFINNKGEEVIKLKYNEARSFVAGKAIVKQDEEWIQINSKGEVVD